MLDDIVLASISFRKTLDESLSSYLLNISRTWVKIACSRSLNDYPSAQNNGDKK